MTCADSSDCAPGPRWLPDCCFPVPQRWDDLGERCQNELAGIYDITWAGLQWRIPLCQYHADEQEAGAAIVLANELLIIAGKCCWEHLRESGLGVVFCPTHGLHRETLAKLAAMARPQIFPQQNNLED